MADILIRSPEVQARTGLPKSTLHNLARAGGFPRPVKLGVRSVAWRVSDVDAWIQGRQLIECCKNTPSFDLQVVETASIGNGAALGRGRGPVIST